MGGRPLMRSFPTTRLLAAGLSLSLSGGLWYAWSADLQFIAEAEAQELRPVPVENGPLTPLLPGSPPDTLSPTDLQKLDRVNVPSRSPRVSADDDQQAQARALIERMLPNATPDEREIWVEQLQGMPLGVAEDLLKFRQQLRPEARSKSSLWSPDSHLNPQTSLPDPLSGNVESGSGGLLDPGEGEPQVDQATLQTLRRIYRQNLLHRHTPGYLRVEPMLGPGRNDGTDNLVGVGLVCIGERLDTTRNASFLETGRGLDVAVEINADKFAHIIPFFAVETSTGPAYTRCGRLEIDTERRLAIRGASGLCPLSPVIQIPEDCNSLEIDESGSVFAVNLASLTDANPRKAVGQIRPVTFVDASQLTYDGAGWLRASVSTGVAKAVDPKLCLFRKGHLERSNVRVDEELAQLQWVEELASGRLPASTNAPPLYAE